MTPRPPRQALLDVLRVLTIFGDRTAALIPVAIFVGLTWRVVAYTRKRGRVVKV